MNEVLWLLSMINDIVFVSLVNTTLQMTLIIALIAILIFLFRIKSSAIRYSLWLFAMFSIIILPLITPLIPQLDPARFYNHGAIGIIPDNLMDSKANNASNNSLSANSESASLQNTPKVTTDKNDVSLINPVSIAYFLWCAGALFMLGITYGMYRKVKKLKVSSPNVEDPATLELLSCLKRGFRIRRQVSLKVSSEIYTPMSLGVLSPTIILPDTITVDNLEMVLIHELAHIRRFDYLVRLIQNTLKVLFFFHPLFHLMNRNLMRAREHICDDWVIAATDRRCEYARCIIGLLEKAIHKPVNIPVIIAMAERKRDVPKRIEMIADRKRKIDIKVSRKALAAMLIIGCLFLFVIGSIELARFAIAKPASNEGKIVFSRKNSGIWVMDADGKSEKRLLNQPTVGALSHDPVWSPNGKRIAFDSYAGDADKWEWDIYTMNTDGSDVKRITGPAEADLAEGNLYPSWSPDGKQIAFTKRIYSAKVPPWGIKSSAIYVMNADGSNMRSLGEDPTSPFTPVWSPDGRKIAYGCTPGNASSLWVMDVDGKNRKMLYSQGGTCASGGIDWSPDGSKIVFDSFQDSWPGWQSNDIFVINADGTGPKRLTQPGLPYYCYFSWSPDGTKIAFCCDQDKEQNGWNGDIYIMDADGSNVQRITNTPEEEWGVDWTASSYDVESAGKLKSTWGKIKERGGF